MNEVNTSATQRTNARAQYQMYPSVTRKSSLKSTNRGLNTIDIVLWFLNNRKSALHMLNTLRLLPLMVSVYF